MSVYHCPLCPLIFQYRTEVEWHLREEHRSRADEDADLRAELAAATAPLDWERLRMLRSSNGAPSVTLLLETAPAAAMTVLDIARLRRLADRARRRLPGEPDRDTPARVVEHRLSKAVSAAESLLTDRGLAVLVNHHHMAIITLPFAPRDRNVVDRGFATRDLEYALRRYPRYRVLVLGRHSRILEGRAVGMSETDDRPKDPDHPRTVLAHGSAQHPNVDALLAHRIAVGGKLPLVIIGDRRQLDEFLQHSLHTSDVVAEVATPRLRKVTIADLAGQALARLHHDQQRRTIADLHHADGQDQIAWGVEAAWNAVRTRAADRLWVEHDYAVPGRTLPGLAGVETTTDPAEPGVIDDLVDALITKAEHLGIPVDLVDKGALNRPEPVAARIPITAPSRGTEDGPRRVNDGTWYLEPVTQRDGAASPADTRRTPTPALPS